MNKVILDKNQRVLIIDDNRSIHDDFRKILSPATDKAAALDVSEAAVFGVPTDSVNQTKFEVDSAYQGEEGVLMVKKALLAGLPYALAFVDVRMPPGLDGVETTRKIWEVDRNIQVVLCTAYSDYSWSEMFEQLGKTDGLLILKKPFDSVEALQLAYTLTEKWWLHELSLQEMETLENRVAERTQQLSKSLSLLEATFESTTDGIIAVDLSGNIVSYNTKYVDIWQFPAGMLGRRNAVEMNACTTGQVKDPAIFLQRVEELKTNPGTIGFDTIELKDGRTFERHVFPQLIDRKCMGTVINWREITERKLAEEVVKESELRFREMLENMNLIAITLDKNGIVTFANDYLLRLTGRTSEEAIGADWCLTFCENPTSEKILLGFHPTNSIPAHHENSIVTKEGKFRSIRWNTTVLLDAHGNTNGTLSIGEDITEGKKLEAQALRTQRLESIGTLASGVAHDLNNVLAPIMMSLQILRRQFPDSRSEHILNTLESSAQRGADIVKQVLTFARGAEGERIALQPKHLLREIDVIMQQTFPKSIHISASIPNNLKIIKGNTTEIHQVLLNLCVNARDAMAHGGKLTVGAENIIIDEQYARMSIEAKPGEYVAFTVTDTGTGIPQEVMDKIFDPFFTTKAKDKGTGLGLSTVLGIVKSHFGFINVYSEINKGTIIKVYFPVEESLIVAETKADDEVPQGRNELILVVDDEPLICEVTKGTLEANGYRVKVGANGREALAVYIQHADDVRLVLTDMSMPIMDGLSTIQALRKFAQKLKIIAVSGLSENIDLLKTSSLNVQALLLKPYTAQKLLMTIHEVLSNA